MILHLGDDVSVHTKDIVAIIDLTDSHSAVTGAMLHDIRRQNRILAKQGITAKSAVVCAGARRPGGITENPRVYLSPISTATLMQRAHEKPYTDGCALAAYRMEHPASASDEEEMGKLNG
ncbi:MAG: DUF370 domain-containing protein [Clostridia bacterium]|nr:DUF370 domain-containing protein [Clostridia bacterium]